MDRRVGVLGGGQLGRMMAAAASLLNVNVAILDVGNDAPAKQILASNNHIDGPFTDSASVKELAQKVDVLTVEIEHVNVAVLEEIEKEGISIEVHPSSQTLRTIQDKFIQKEHLKANGLSVADYLPVEASLQALGAIGREFGYPFMLKSRTLAYDGKGNYVVKSAEDYQEALQTLSDRPLYAERWAPFVKEVAVMVVRSSKGEVVSYPAVETVHQDNICHLVFAPLRHPDPQVAQNARILAEKAVSTFTGAGVFGVELFLLADGALLINEIAPRPHNSGHYTIEACYTSQYENHLRAILGLPLGDTSMKVSSSIMLNILGMSSSMTDVQKLGEAALAVRGASIHLYGKKESRKGRKLGHITIVGDSDSQTRESLRPLLDAYAQISGRSGKQEIYAPPSPQSSHDHIFPLVGVIMGSDSDLPVMKPAAEMLESFGIPYELTIVSAHRTPDRMVQYAKSAASRGIRVIVAGAGGAAHLPGMVAALTALPVIGVPVKGSSLDGVDSLHSIVQMPRGIPVATVAINNGTNAGLLAVRILAASKPDLREKMEDYLQELNGQVMDKVDTLKSTGWKAYVIKK